MPGLTVLAAATEPWVRWDWVSSHGQEILQALREHVLLTASAVGLGLLIAIPVALACLRWHRLLSPVLYVTGFLYTIPSIAAFAALVYWTGLSRWTAIIPLVSYTLLILIRNIVSGLDGVPAEVREAAEGMGYTRSRQLLRVELPLALPVIVAGIRIAVVTTIGLVTVAALVGQGGLGQMIIDGMQANFFLTKIVIGSVLSVALAVVADLSLAGIQRIAMPWSRGGRAT